MVGIAVPRHLFNVSPSAAGWPYGLNGKLAKAHCFDSVSNFENGEDGLYSAYVHVDQRGSV